MPRSRTALTAAFGHSAEWIVVAREVHSIACKAPDMAHDEVEIVRDLGVDRIAVDAVGVVGERVEAQMQPIGVILPLIPPLRRHVGEIEALGLIVDVDMDLVPYSWCIRCQKARYQWSKSEL